MTATGAMPSRDQTAEQGGYVMDDQVTSLTAFRTGAPGDRVGALCMSAIAGGSDQE